MTKEEQLISKYLKLNGIIAKKDLLNLMNDNHNYKLTAKKLDDIVKKLNGEEYLNDYYNVIEELPLEQAKVIINQKNTFPKYKQANLDEFDYEEAFIKEMETKLKELNLISLIKDILGGCTIMIKLCMYSKNKTKELLTTINPNITTKELESIDSIIKKYKNDLPIWGYNGFTINEFNKLNKKIKVGRNDPCPCGSGLKYKKCCGK